MQTVAFIIPPSVELLDLAGPVQVFTEAKFYGFEIDLEFYKWVKECADKKVFVCSVCNGAFALGEAGLLKDTECTTHWRRIEELQARFPDARVITDILFKKSNNVYTSAGISAGIDL